MEVDESLVQHVARLARLALTDEEVATYRKQLASILKYVDQLGELDVKDVEPLAHAGDFTNVFRADKSRPGLPPEEALRNAPEQADSFFIVPRVIDE